MYTQTQAVLRSRRMYSVFQIKSCLCWQVLVTLIHGSNEGQLVDINVIKSTERIFKELLRSTYPYRREYYSVRRQSTRYCFMPGTMHHQQGGKGVVVLFLVWGSMYVY